MHRFTTAVACAGLAALLGLAGCLQEVGDRCQVKDDCESPLVCNTSTKTCQASNNNPTGIDGGPDAPNDAAVIDATVIDAIAIDAVAIDALEIDAPL